MELPVLKFMHDARDILGHQEALRRSVGFRIECFRRPFPEGVAAFGTRGARVAGACGVAGTGCPSGIGAVPGGVSTGR